MRRLLVATFGRSDYSSCLPILRVAEDDPDVDVAVIAAGTHPSAAFGRTIDAIHADGFRIVECIDMAPADDRASSAAAALGAGTVRFAAVLDRERPDLLLIVGDRLELLAAIGAALPQRIPVAHVSGGDVTEGAIDNQVRHAVTKSSHLHFVALPEHAARLRQMGEEPWRITASGDPALDLVDEYARIERAVLAEALGIGLHPPVIVVSYHPTTLGERDPSEEIDELLAALDGLPGTFVLSGPNPDAGHAVIRARLQEFSRRSAARMFASLGQRWYFGLLAHADLIIGNSSSAIWEAPSFRLPAVDVGDRQRARVRAKNVIQVPARAAEIRSAIDRALDPAFRRALHALVNPYGDGCAAPRIVDVLKRCDLGPVLLQKIFVDFDVSKVRA